MDWFGTSMRPLAGGYSSETYLVETEPPVVLRIYRRQPQRAQVDASLLRLVRGIVAVPRVLEVRGPTGEHPGVLVTELLEGVALDAFLRSGPTTAQLRDVGTNLGEILGALAGIPFLAPGFFVDAQLAVSSAGMPDDLAEWAALHRDTSRLASWPESDWRALQRLVDTAQRLLDDRAGQTPARFVLVHSDFNAKNILVDPESCAVVGVVDWEFAHAGSVHADLGNLTRFERDERLVGPLLDSLATSTSGSRPQPLKHARATDLWALIELAGRAPGNPVAAHAETLLLAQARSGDLMAWPWAGSRVDPGGAGHVS